MVITRGLPTPSLCSSTSRDPFQHKVPVTSEVDQVLETICLLTIIEASTCRVGRRGINGKVGVK
jgi:hypothetical protein